jgi:hypothetical protein
LTLPFGPFLPRLQFQVLTKNPHLSTIAIGVSPCQVRVGEFSDEGREVNRAGSIAAIPEMEREQGEQKANRDTNGFRNSRNNLKTHGHTIF